MLQLNQTWGTKPALPDSVKQDHSVNLVIIGNIHHKPQGPVLGGFNIRKYGGGGREGAGSTQIGDYFNLHGTTT